MFDLEDISREAGDLFVTPSYEEMNAADLHRMRLTADRFRMTLEDLLAAGFSPYVTQHGFITIHGLTSGLLYDPMSGYAFADSFGGSGMRRYEPQIFVGEMERLRASMIRANNVINRGLQLLGIPHTLTACNVIEVGGDLQNIAYCLEEENGYVNDVDCDSPEKFVEAVRECFCMGGSGGGEAAEAVNAAVEIA